MSIGLKIKNRRLRLNYTLEELAKHVGTSKQTIHRYESGVISNIPSDKIELLAKALKTTPAYLMGWESEDIFASENIMPPPSFIQKPRLGTIACGEPITAEQNIETYDNVPENIKCDFTLKCKGDSMIDARIMDGDIVYIKEQPMVENGQIAAVLIGDEATLKRVYISDGTVTLLPCNAKYAPMVYSGEDLNNIKIIGKAVGFTSIIE